MVTPPPVGTEIKIQESATGFGTVDGSVDDNNAGFTGAGFANTDNASGKGVTWTICVPASGSYSFVWRHANGGSTDRTAKVLVDGVSKISSVSFPSTGSWTTWSNTTVQAIALSAGTHVIRLEATNGSGLSNIDYISVTGDAPVAGLCSASVVSVTGVEVSASSISLNVGSNATLSATVLPSNAANKSVSWSSSNTSVATVSTSGVVTGVAAGSATITVTTADGNKTATSAITVNAIVTPPTPSVTGINGPACVEPNTATTFTLNPDVSQFTQAGWWSTSGGTFTVSASNNKNVSVVFPSNLNGTTITIYAGANFSVSPYYKQYTKSVKIGSCSQARFANEDATSDISNFEISAYPTPVNNVLYVDFSTEVSENVDVILYDVNGNSISTKTVNGNGTSIDMSNLSTGVYVVKVAGANFNKEVRVVKQ